MNRIARITMLAASLVLALASVAGAQSASTNLSVTAAVINNCTITTAAVAFGNYDPVSANLATPLDATGGVTVRCTKGAGTRIDLDNGQNFSGGSRRMAGGGEFLNYALYQDAPRTTNWGSGAGSGRDIPAAPSAAPRTFTVYGRVPEAQDVAAGGYTDTVLATVNF